MENHKITRIISSTLSLVLGLQFFAIGAWAGSKTSGASVPIAGLFTGPPPSIGVDVPESAFRTQKVYKINPEFMNTAWLNWEWFWDHNITMPSEDKINEFKKEIVEESGWGIPGPKDPPGMFDMTKSKMVWIDFYGGNHMGTNSGSGRASSAGGTQMKANGATVMVTSEAIEMAGSLTSHKDGDSTLEDVSTEFIGEFADREYPHGANRPLALYQRSGNSKNFAGVIHNPRGMAWREFPQRLAQYEPAPGQKEKLGEKKILKWSFGGKKQYTQAEIDRIQEVLQYLPKALPKPNGHVPGTPEEEIREGALEFTRRVAEQRALEFGLGLQQGSNSASNRGLGGDVLDTATFTSLPQRFKFKLFPDDAPFGTTGKIKTSQVGKVFQDIRSFLPPSLKQALPDKSELNHVFDLAYKNSVREQMLLQAGTPPLLAQELVNDPKGRDFADFLHGMALSGFDQKAMSLSGLVDFLPKGVEYDLNKILPAMTAVNDPTPENLSAAIRIQVPREDVRSQLIESYLAFQAKLQSTAQKEGFSNASLKSFQREQSLLRSSPIEDLQYAKLKIKNLWEIQKSYRRGDDYSNYQTFIDGILQRSRRTYKDAKPTDMVIEEQADKVRGTRVRRIFDAKQNHYTGDVLIRIQDGQGFFYGKKIPIAELETATLVSDGHSVRGQLSADGKTFEFRAPISDAATSFSFKLVSGNHSQTWLPYNDQPVFSFASRDSVETPIPPKKPAYDHDPEKVVAHEAGDMSLTPIIAGRQYISLPIDPHLSGAEQAAIEPHLNEAFKTTQAYLAVQNVQQDGATPPTVQMNALNKNIVRGHFSAEVAGTEGSNSFDRIVRSLTTRYEANDFRGISGDKPWNISNHYDFSNPTEATAELQASLVERFGVTPEVAASCLNNLFNPTAKKRTEPRSNMKVEQWIPFWNWEESPFVAESKKPLLKNLTRAFIETIANQPTMPSANIKSAMKTWANASNLDKDIQSYLRMPLAQTNPDLYKAKVTGPIDVNEIEMGHEFTASFPINAQTKFSVKRFAHGDREWMFTRYDLTPQERKDVIKSIAQDLGTNLNDGKSVPVEGESTGHGHDLSIGYSVKDKDGKPWRVEWDGVGRAYDSGDEVFGDSVGRGHIELVTPKYRPSPALSEKVFQTLRENNLYPNNAVGGGHLSVDLSVFDGKPEAMARWLLFLHENRGIMSLMFQHVNRQNTALHFDLTPELQAGLKRIAEGHGSEADLKKLLYDSKYFNDRVGRKTRYTAWNITDYFQDVIPQEFLTKDFNIKNDPWHPQFITHKQGRRAEFRMADAPGDSEETGLFTKLVRASLNYALNEKTPVNTEAQDVDYQAYLVNSDYAYTDLAHLCKEAHLNPADYEGMVEKGLATTEAAMQTSHYRSLDEKRFQFPKAEELPGLKKIWGKAVDPRSSGEAIESSQHEWEGSPTLSERIRQGKVWWARKQAARFRETAYGDHKVGQLLRTPAEVELCIKNQIEAGQ